MPQALTESQITQKLSDLEFNWKLQNRHLVISVTTSDFTEAIWAINEIAQLAEELNHHPDLRLTGYNNLEISTITHSEEAITEKDFALAEKIEGVLTRLTGK